MVAEGGRERLERWCKDTYLYCPIRSYHDLRLGKWQVNCVGDNMRRCQLLFKCDENYPLIMDLFELQSALHDIL